MMESGSGGDIGVELPITNIVNLHGLFLYETQTQV